MPDFGGDSFAEPDLIARGDGFGEAPGKADREFATQYNGARISTPGASILATGLGSVVDLVDTVSSSVLPGFDRGDVNQGFLNAIGSPGLTQFFDENQGAIEVGSGIAGTVVADYVAGRVLRPAGVVMQSIRGVPYVRKLAALDAQYDRAKRVAMLTQEEVARRGLTGTDRFLGGAMNVELLGVPTVLSRAESTSALFRAGAAKTTARTLATEGVMAATLHTNDFLYSDDLMHNLAWSAAGVGIAGVADSLIQTYALRKMANSASVRQLNRGAYDVTGFESQRLASQDTVNRLLAESGANMDDIAFHWQGAGGITDNITSTLIQASENRLVRSATETEAVLSGKREQFATHLIQLAHEDTQKVTTRGLYGVSNSQFHLDMEGLGKPLKEAMDNEPTFLLGVEELGTLPEGTTFEAMHNLRKSQIEKKLTPMQKILADGYTVKKSKTKDGTPIETIVELQADEIDDLRRQTQELIYRNSHVPWVMFEAGEKAPLSHAKMLDGWAPRDITVEGGLGSGNKAIWQLTPGKGLPRLGIGSDGEIYLPDGVSRLEQLDTHQMLDLYRLGRKMVNHYKNVGEQFTVPENANWFQLDLAEQLIRETGEDSSVLWGGKMTREQAYVESFAQKVDLLKRKEAALRMAKTRGVDAELDTADIFRLKVMFNLPRLSPYQSSLLSTSETPIDILLHGFKSGKQVRDMGYQELLKGINDARKLMGLTDHARPSVKDLHGNSFRFLSDADGETIKPIMGYTRPMNPYEWTRDDLFIRQAMKDAHVSDTLQSGDPITRALAVGLTSDPSFGQARKVMELADDQHRSFVPGFRNSAPQTATGAAINAVTARGRRDVDSLTMLAQSAQKDIQTRLTQAIAKEVFAPMSPLITEVTATRNARSLMLLNQLYSFGHGWEYVPGKFVEQNLPSGEKAWALMLDETSVLNQKRFQINQGRKLEKGQLLLNPEGKPVILDELARKVFEASMAVHKITLDAKNTLLRSQNLPEIANKWGYISPPSLKGKYVAFTFDAGNNVVPDMTLIGDSPEHLAKLREQATKSNLWKPGYRIRTKDDVTEFMTLWDKAQMDFISPNTTAVQPKKQSFGRSGGANYNSKAFEESLVTMRDSLMQHGSDVLEVLHEDVLKALRARAAVARTESAVGKKLESYQSIYDRAYQNLTGQNALGAKDSFFGDLYSWGEKKINGFLNSSAADKAANAGGVMADWIRYAVPGKSSQGEEFQKLSQELGHYMPFKSISEKLAAESGEHVPRDIADITSKLSWFEASSRLRWFESMHAVVNLGSIIANTPSVIRALQPRVGETIAEAGARNSNLAMALHVKDGQSIMVPNTFKVLWQGMRDMWKPSGDSVIEAAKAQAFRRGYMSQEVAEMHRSWGAIDSKAGWRGFFFGDESRRAADLKGPFKGTRAKIAQSGGIDKWLGILSDRSEDLSRQWSMQSAYRVGRAMGIDNPNELNNFAHEITNKIIANYDPRNRPEVFQGPLGAPIGLFQSYAHNMYSRLFRYIETGDKHALATQLGMQSAVFGVHSAPGWDALNWAFFDQGQAKGDDPVESMYNRFGQNDGDLIMHGVLSNLPKIFGAEGAALYTRGDAAVRLPGTQWTEIGGVPVPQIPTIDTLSRIVKGIGQGLAAFAASDGSVSGTQLAEIASNMLTNRPIAGIIETFGAHGNDTSWDGQLVTRSKQASEQLYRIIGIRSMAQQKQIDAFYSSKTAEEEQGARKDAVNEAARAAIRAGNYDDLPGLFEKYVEEGGNPRYYTQWKKRITESALKTRGERALEKAFKSRDNRSNAAIGRLIDGQVDVREGDMALEDYGSESQTEDLVSKNFETVPNAIGDPTGDSFPVDDIEE